MPKISELPTIPAAGTKLVASDGGGDAGNVLASDFATAGQGALADTAVQPGDLASVATTGAYSDLSGLPTLGDMAAKDDVGVSDINATGTPSSLTFLRGDGQWVAGGASGVATVTGDLVDNSDPANPIINNPTVAEIDATGTADNTTFLRGDGQWATPSGMGLGDVTGPSSATDNNIAVFDGATGKIIKDGGINSGTFATAAQGALADTAIQPADLGTAAYEDVGDFATAAQGALADTAVQPGALGTLAGGNNAGDVPYSNATSGLTATDVQAAIDEIVASGGGDWEQIGAPVTASSGTSVAFTSIPADYSDLMVILSQVRHNHSAGTNIYLDVSDDNGTTWSAGDVAALPTITQNVDSYGRAYIYDYNSNEPFIFGTARSIADPAPSIANSGPFMTMARVDGGLSALRFRLTNGAFTGSGTFTLLGRK